MAVICHVYIWAPTVPGQGLSIAGMQMFWELKMQDISFQMNRLA
jgi:hypothetical protein